MKMEFTSTLDSTEVGLWKVNTWDTMERIMYIIGSEVVAYLKSYTDETRPPVARGASALSRLQNRKDEHRMARGGAGPRFFAEGGARPAHPGGWGDITHDLMAKYDYKVTRTPEGISLAIFNTSDHAVYVEAMDGFYVVRGVMDEDGPVIAALRRIISQVAPGWRVV
jgi:hypothetical protein